MKNKNNLGAVYVREGFFGWKAEFLSWSPIDYERKYENLNGQKRHGENLIFGLIKDGDERLIQHDDKNAKILDLGMLPSEGVEKNQLKGLYIWYFESETAIEEGKIKLINKTTKEVIDEMDL